MTSTRITIRFRSRRVLALLAAALATCSATAEGAVVLRIQGDGENHTALTGEADDLFTHLESVESSRTGPEESNPLQDEEREDPFAGRGTSSSTTSSSPSGSPAGSSSASLNPNAGVPSNLSLAGWVLGEARCILPNPPGTELLKPPEA